MSETGLDPEIEKKVYRPGEDDFVQSIEIEAADEEYREEIQEFLERYRG